jgi:hypothetical protein
MCTYLCTLLDIDADCGLLSFHLNYRNRAQGLADRSANDGCSILAHDVITIQVPCMFIILFDLCFL